MHKRRNRDFRPDIEGLRAIAVLGVVLYHVASQTNPNHVGLVRGGFVGVDVFFVVSGYLITGLLWKELSGTGRISFAAFYGRRARRLLPASILVIVVTALAARQWLPPLQTPSVAKDGIASALYVGNYRFALDHTSYLSTAIPSPFQHYWSLGVEEQFYLLWPLLLVGGALAWRRRHRYQRYRLGGGGPEAGGVWPDRTAAGLRPDRTAAGLVLGAVTVLSLFLSLWLTHADQPWAFFSLPARAWELGAGGLLALAAPATARMGPRPAVVLGWAGLALTVGSMFVISPRTPFPGTAAVLPVLGTVAVLAAGEAVAAQRLERGPVRVLGQPGMKMIGRISYSWYLWHWPFLILAPYALGHAAGHPLGLWQNLLVAALSGIVATASFLLIETPARSSRWLTAIPRRSLVTGGTLSAGGAVACIVVAATLPSLTGHGIVAAPTIRGITARSQLAADRRAPGTTVPAAVARVDLINAQINAQIARSVAQQDVPANLTPSLGGAKGDDPVVFVDGCMDSYLDASVQNCLFGDETSSTSIVLFGDSHAAMWFPAVDAAANQHGWQLHNWTKATCPPIEIPIVSPVLGRTFTECENWRQSVLARIQATHPALVVLAVARHYTSIYGFTPYQQPWLQGLGEMVSTIRRMGSKVAVIGPVPKPPVIVPDCLSSHLTSATACTVPVAQAINETGEEAERAAVVGAGGYYINTQPWFCTSTTCAVMLGNIEMWRDDNHITATYSSFLGPAMSAELAAAAG